MKLSERIRDSHPKPTPAGDCWYLWLDQLEELEKLETQFEAELNAAKNDYDRIKQLKAELAEADDADMEVRKEVAQLEDELKRCRKLAHSYIEAYEKLAFIDALEEGE